MRTTALGLVVLVAGLLTAPACRADVFVLTNGGRVEGELLNPEERPRRSYEVQLSGGKVTLDASQVQQVVRLLPEEREYERVRRLHPDTVEGQWALAEWCRDRGLLTQRDTHLERIIELSPNHVEARHALGYSQVDGQWERQDEINARRGLFRYKGRYRTKQEIELMEAQRQQELEEKAWFQKVNRWRGWLGTDKDHLARQSLMAIDDPLAVRALSAALAGDKGLLARLLYIEVLAKLGTPEALRVLAATAIEDGNEEVRQSCLDCLEKKKTPEAVAYFVSQLRSKDNRMVRRAAVALKRMRDPSAVAPLIDALVTTHKFKVSGGNPGQMQVGFGNAAPGGLAVGGGPKIYTKHIANQEVLDALVALTGQNFDFDGRTWKYWYASRRRPEVLEGRRD